MASDLVFRGLNVFHRGLVKLSGGRIGWTAGKMPVVELVTTGRKSGEKRSVMLTSPHREGDSILVVASRAGDDAHPAWYLNLRDDPAVEVSMKGADSQPYTARIVPPEERAPLWDVVVGKYDNYAGYQEKTDREIPLVYLDPV